MVVVVVVEDADGIGGDCRAAAADEGNDEAEAIARGPGADDAIAPTEDVLFPTDSENGKKEDKNYYRKDTWKKKNECCFCSK